MLLLSVPVSSLYPAPDSVFTSKRRSPNSLYIYIQQCYKDQAYSSCLFVALVFLLQVVELR